jgi:hypothetical protein
MGAWIKKNRQTLFRLGGSSISAVLLVSLLVQEWDKVLAAIRQVSASELLAAFALVMASRLFTVLRWHTLLRSGGVPIHFRDTLSLTFTGLFASNFLFTTIGGDVVRLAGTMQLGYDRAVCLASLAADRLINMAGMSLASPLGLYQMLPTAGLALQSISLAALWQKGWDFARRTLASLTIWLKKPLSLLLALAFAFGHMLCMFSANYIIIHALGAELPLWRVVGLFSLGYFIGLVPVSVNGYGWQELTTTTLLTTFGGVDVSISSVVALFHRVLMMAASLPGALTLPGMLAKMDKSQE